MHLTKEKKKKKFFPIDKKVIYKKKLERDSLVNGMKKECLSELYEASSLKN